MLVVASAARAESPAEARIAAAEQRIATRPSDADARLALAIAWTQRARETADEDCYERAASALAKARALGLDDTEADRVAIWIDLGRHEFARAEASARASLARHPDDPILLGLHGDALMELERHDEAAIAYQRALELRPGPATFVRGAHWREATGDLDGARELLLAALRATAARETEEQAWIRVQLAQVEAREGNVEAAREQLDAALVAFPGYHAALEARSELRQGRERAHGNHSHAHGPHGEHDHRPR
jgi:tetratricopeptide (TPR) repeat protein